MECDNCFVNKSPCWRKINGIFYCNACGLHFMRKKVHKDATKSYAKILIKLKHSNY